MNYLDHLEVIRINWSNQNEHRDSICELFQDETIRKWFHPKSNPETVWRTWISYSCDATSNQKAHSYLAYDGSKLIGLSGVRSEILGSELRLEIDWHVITPYQGQGIGYGLARKALNGTLTDSIFRVIARIDPGNIPSNRIAQKIGMRRFEASNNGFNLWYID
jgi:RimJ/RimL family protein N-acetyltransferase